MNLDEYEKMAEREDAYWWHVGRNHIVRYQLEVIGAQLQRPALTILNVGCGTGGTVPTLAAFGEVHNVDTEPEALKFLERRGIRNGRLVQGIELPYPDATFDVIVALDVLEHIDAENAALREWRRVLKPNGELLIMVPAHSWLWSGHDEALRHFRRYNRSHLGTALRLAGFDVVKKSYAVAFSFPLVAGYRMLTGLLGKTSTRASYVGVPGPINRLFGWILKMEGRWLRYFGFPFGTSVLARARVKHAP